MSFQYDDPLIYKQRSGQPGDEFVPLSESHKIINQKILLHEQPVRINRIQISGYVEVNELELGESLAANEFVCDYVNGILSFATSEEGKTCTVVYYGKGTVLFPASRIWTAENGGEVTQTLAEIIEAGESAIGNLEQIQQVIDEAEAATNAANTAVTNANTTNSNITSAESSRVTAENNRASAEGTRATNESTRQSNETGRVTAETNRATAESARVSAESSRATVESNRVTAESGRVTAENSRGSAETTRGTNETTRQNQESARQSQESTRQTNETNRGTAETSRVNAESSRVTAETNRASAETGRVNAESARVTAENARASAETTRNIAESSRVTAENNRSSAETTRQNNESARQSQESSRQSGYTAFTLLEPYNNSKSYVPLNKVTYQGSTYQCILACTGNVPTNTTYWILIAAKGTDGTGSGTVTSVTSANSDISIINSTSTPVLTLNTGTGANQIVKTDGGGKLPLSTIPNNIAPDWSNITNKPTSFIPPIATTSVLGGVKQGSNVTIAGDGTISVAAPYSHPSGDGNLHVPATGTGNNTKVLKAGATAGSISWAGVDWAEITGKPSTFPATAHDHLRLDSVDDRDIKPDITTKGFMESYFASLAGLNGTASSGDYQDVIVLNSYTDTTGGKVNALVLDKASFIIRHYQATQTDTAWGSPKVLAYDDVVTTSVKGLMSAADKTKLDGIAASANNYSHPTGDGNLHVPATGTGNNTKVLKAGSTAGSISWAAVDWSELTGKPSTFAPPIATSSVLGGVKQGANVTIAGDGTISVAAPYSHPSSHSATMITITDIKNFYASTDVENALAEVGKYINKSRWGAL